MTRIICDFDTGSMYGNRPVCDRPAQWTVTYRSCGDRLVSHVCARHLRAEVGRVYPYRYDVAPVAETRDSSLPDLSGPRYV